jgi:hypothetical protein
VQDGDIIFFKYVLIAFFLWLTTFFSQGWRLYYCKEEVRELLFCWLWMLCNEVQNVVRMNQIFCLAWRSSTHNFA